MLSGQLDKRVCNSQARAKLESTHVGPSEYRWAMWPGVVMSLIQGKDEARVTAVFKSHIEGDSPS
jgi:hypothetical protein